MPSGKKDEKSIKINDINHFVKIKKS